MIPMCNHFLFKVLNITTEENVKSLATAGILASIT